MAVILSTLKSDTINTETLKENMLKLRAGLISPSREVVKEDIAIDHSADPIKSMDDIFRISQYLISRRRYRDNMLFILGINFGLRISDLRVLRFANLINDNLTFKDTFPVFERKTRNTRKKRMNRYITVNAAVMEAVTLYLENTENVCLSDYMFRSESNNGYQENIPMTIQSVNRILTGIAKELNLPIHMSSHTLRKTFCYHQMLMSHNDPRKLMLLQKMLNHSTPAQTLEYIGITSEEIEDAYQKLNLGSKTFNYLAGAEIVEKEEVC